MANLKLLLRAPFLMCLIRDFAHFGAYWYHLALGLEPKYYSPFQVFNLIFVCVLGFFLFYFKLAFSFQ